MIRALLVIVLLLALALGYALWGKARADARADRDAATAEQALADLEKANAILAIERWRVQRMAEIAAEAEIGREDAKAESDRLLADLRADNRKLRSHWQAALATNELSRAAAASGFADGGAELRQRDIADIRGIVGRCQANVRGLQAVVLSDRSTP